MSKRSEDGRERFSGFHFGMDDWGSAGVSPAAFGVLAECRNVCNGTLQTAVLHSPAGKGRTGRNRKRDRGNSFVCV